MVPWSQSRCHYRISLTSHHLGGRGTINKRRTVIRHGVASGICTAHTSFAMRVSCTCLILHVFRQHTCTHAHACVRWLPAVAHVNSGAAAQLAYGACASLPVSCLLRLTLLPYLCLFAFDVLRSCGRFLLCRHGKKRARRNRAFCGVRRKDGMGWRLVTGEHRRA